MEEQNIVNTKSVQSETVGSESKDMGSKSKIDMFLSRYYGDNVCTKSKFYVIRYVMDGTGAWKQRDCFFFDACEPRYADYEKTFKGASRYCLPRGCWKLRMEATPYGPMGLKLPKCPGHRQVYIGWSDTRQWKEGEIMIGYSSIWQDCDSSEEREELMMKWQKESTIHSGKQAYDVLEKIVYEAFRDEAEIFLQVDNDGITDNRDNQRQTEDEPLFN